jgi:hypothetical protein
MTQNNRERMIARYTGGRMLPEEERRFLKLAEKDPELRRAIEAERAIDRTLRRDRDALPRITAETRSHVLAMLGALDPAPPVTIRDGTGIGMIALIAAGIGLAIGALFLARPHEESVATTPPRPAATAVELRGSTPQPLARPSPSTTMTMEKGGEANTVGGERSGTVEPRPSQPRAIPLRRRIETADNTITSAKVAIRTPTKLALRSVPSIADTAVVPTLTSPPARIALPLPPRIADSTHINITIDLDRMKRKPRQP